MVERVKRQYHSPLRAEQARQTRLRILEAARSLFLEQGYPVTSVETIAVEAGVAPDTVYSVFRSKRNLLKQLMDLTVGGDDSEVKVLERGEPQAARRERDQHRQVAMFAAGVTLRIEAVRPLDDILRSAAAVDPEVAALRDDLQLRQRRSAMSAFAEWLSSNGPLRAGVDVEDAGAIIWTLTSPDVHRLLRDECGWSGQRFQGWLEDTLVRTLLPDR
ncbi:MAG: TetR/AcrR family transcriptional regulator [Chloroflexi bacterium]|nr:MAG: TetR/AcrR family transcriptional regulator [Chloroflexota bacterium]